MKQLSVEQLIDLIDMAREDHSSDEEYRDSDDEVYCRRSDNCYKDLCDVLLDQLVLRLTEMGIEDATNLDQDYLELLAFLDIKLTDLERIPAKEDILARVNEGLQGSSPQGRVERQDNMYKQGRENQSINNKEEK